jgi:hypothetical protein
VASELLNESLNEPKIKSQEVSDFYKTNILKFTCFVQRARFFLLLLLFHTSTKFDLSFMENGGYSGSI